MGECEATVKRYINAIHLPGTTQVAAMMRSVLILYTLRKRASMLPLIPPLAQRIHSFLLARKGDGGVPQFLAAGTFNSDAPFGWSRKQPIIM